MLATDCEVCVCNDNLRQSLELCAQRLTSETLQHCGTNNLTMSKFTEKMTQHTERLATARTQFGEVSDVQIQRFEDALRMAEGDDGYVGVRYEFLAKTDLDVPLSGNGQKLEQYLLPMNGKDGWKFLKHCHGTMRTTWKM